MSDDAGHDTTDEHRVLASGTATSPRAFGRRRTGRPADPGPARSSTQPHDGATHPIEIRSRYFLSEIF